MINLIIIEVAAITVMAALLIVESYFTNILFKWKSKK